MLELDIELERGPFTLRGALRTDGQVLGLFGPSGSGKTSLLMAIAGLLPLRAGRLAIGDRVLFDSRRGLRVPPHRREVALVFQDDRLFPHYSVRGNLLFGYRRTAEARRRLHPPEVIALLGLDDLLERPVASLSGGERKRVAIGRALLTSPRLLMLDEPLAGLDADRRLVILAYLKRLHERLPLALVYVSHTLPDFLALCDQAAEIEDGRIEPLGHPHDLINRARSGLESIFFGTVRAADPNAGTLEITVGNVVLKAVSHRSASPGSRTAVSIHAEDVLLSTDPAPRTSARNILRGRIEEIQPCNGSLRVTVDAGITIHALVTGEAEKDLDLKAGKPVTLLLKAHAVQATPIVNG